MPDHLAGARDSQLVCDLIEERLIASGGTSMPTSSDLPVLEVVAPLDGPCGFERLDCAAVGVGWDLPIFIALLEPDRHGD